MGAGLQLEIVRILASGGFGTVAAVRDRRSGTHYAAKVIRPEHLTNSKVLVRVRDEAALLTRLQHPHIVQVHGLVHIADRPVVLMEWIQGAPLHEVISATGGLSAADAAQIVIQAAEALNWAYDAPDPLDGRPLRVIHRDLKPSNMLLTVDGRVKLVDFGIAHGQFAGKASVTNSMVLGTRDYVAPERLDGEADHPAGDVYALGMVLYELIAGGRLSQSMFFEQHRQRLDRQLARLSPKGLDAERTAALRELLTAMCGYMVSARPTHREVAERLAAIFAGGEAADLPGVGERVVRRLLAVPQDEPRLHPDYPELCFLEDPDGVAPSEVDARVREILRQPRWSDQRSDLARLLAADPTWTAAPFAELLDERNPPRWMFWASRMQPDELAAVFELVAARADPVVLRHAKGSLSHSDPNVARAARQIVQRSQS